MTAWPAWILASACFLALGVSKSVIVGVSWIFTFCALRTLPITIATPIRASAPALVILVALGSVFRRAWQHPFCQ